MANATSTQLQELYVAYFGRAADPTGLDYWTNKGISQKDFAANMHAQPEFDSEYGSKSVEEQVNQIYKNLFDREADVTGLNYWTLQINLGNLKLAEIASDLIWAAQNNSGSSDDKTALANRSAAAVAYTAEVAKTTAGILAYQPTNDGKEEDSTFLAGANITEAKSYMSSIDKDTAHTDAGITSSVSSIIATGAPSATGTTYTLTKYADTGLGSTAGNDSYTASVIADGGGESTLTPGDILDGGAGTDTLNVSISGTATAAVTSTAYTTTNIETLKVTNFETSANLNTINTALMTGLTSIDLNSSGSNGDTTITELSSILPVSMQNGNQDLTLQYTEAVLDGTDDTHKLTVSSQTGGTFTVTDSDSDFVETIDITSSGSKNTIDLAAANKHTTVNVLGDTQITLALNDTNNTVETVDASAATGKVILTDLGTTELTYTGGSGDDTLRIDGSTVGTTDALNAGEGTDTLQLTVAANVTAATSGAVLTNFETLEGYASASDASLVVAQDVAKLGSTITNIGVTTWARSHGTTNGGDDYTATDGINFTNLDSGTNLSLSGITATGLDTNDGAIVNFTATADLESDTGSDSIDVTLGTANTAMSTATTGTNTAVNMTLALADYETINFTTQGGDTTVASLTSNDATKLTFAGDKKLTITAFTSTSVATVDASAATKVVFGAAVSNKDVTITGGTGDSTYITGTGADNITGGAGKDQITGGTGNDTITSGDGDDTINEVTGDDTVTTGAGNDTIIIADFSDLTSKDTIDAGAGTDTIKFSEAANHDFTSDTTIVANVSGVEKYTFSGLNGSDTVTINDAAIDGTEFTVEFTSDVSADTNIMDASGVLSSATTLTFNDNSGDIVTYKVANATEVVDMGVDPDIIQVTVNAYIAAADSIDGGAGSDNLSFTADTNAGTTTFTGAAALSGVKNVETLTFNQATDTNAHKYKLTLDDAFVDAQIDAGSTLTITRDAGNDGILEVTGTSVSKDYKLAMNGGDGADKFIGGKGDDIFFGEAGADTFDLSAGGSDDIKIVEATDGNSKITGTTFRGTATTAPTGIDRLLLSSDQGTSNADVFNGGALVFAATDSGAVGAEVTLTSTDYNEVAGNATAGSDTGLSANHVNVITSRGYADLDTALKANGVDDDNITDVDGAGIVVFFNTSTQVAEVHYVSIFDGANTGEGTVTTTSTQIGNYTDMALADMANFGYENFGTFGE